MKRRAQVEVKLILFQVEKKNETEKNERENKEEIKDFWVVFQVIFFIESQVSCFFRTESRRMLKKTQKNSKRKPHHLDATFLSLTFFLPFFLLATSQSFKKRKKQDLWR